MTPSQPCPRDQVSIPTLPAPEFDPPTGGEPINLAHVADTLVHVLTIGAAVALVLVLVGYVVACALWPYKVCPRCKGESRLVIVRRSRTVRARSCRRCRGHGLVLRHGRRAWNQLARFRHARRADRKRRPWNDGRPGPHSF